MKNNFESIVGFDFQFQTKPIPAFDFDGIFYCKTVFLEHSSFEKKENLSLYNGLLNGWIEKLHNIAKLLNAELYGNTND